MQQMVLEYIHARIPQARRQEVVERVRAHEIDPYSAARCLLGDALGVVEIT